jgi:hypothetical protein
VARAVHPSVEANPDIVGHGATGAVSNDLANLVIRSGKGNNADALVSFVDAEEFLERKVPRFDHPVGRVVVGHEKVFVGFWGLAKMIHAAHAGHPQALRFGGRLQALLPLEDGQAVANPYGIDSRGHHLGWVGSEADRRGGNGQKSEKSSHADILDGGETAAKLFKAKSSFQGLTWRRLRGLYVPNAPRWSGLPNPSA